MYRSKGLDVVQGEVFKDRARERVADCVTSSWTFSRLVDGEVIRSQHHQSSGLKDDHQSSGLEDVASACLWVSQLAFFT